MKPRQSQGLNVFDSKFIAQSKWTDWVTDGVVVVVIVAAAAAAADDDVDVRVKELGPGEIKLSSETSAAAAAAAATAASTPGVNESPLLSPQKSDLALLRNANVPVTSLSCCLYTYVYTFPISPIWRHVKRMERENFT